MLDNQALWMAAGFLLLLVLVGVATEVVRRRGPGRPGAQAGRHRRPHRDSFRPDGESDAVGSPPRKRAAIIVNPTKFADPEPVRRRINDICAEHGWAEPLWLETTPAEPGTHQALQAVAAGAVVVCPLGGDGTVRAVAAGVVGTETPLGLLPGGTGNLLARNLDLPVDSLDRALRVALTGQNKRVDVGWLTLDRSAQPARPERREQPDQPDQPDRPEQHLFLVMAGLGFDAAIMAGAPERLKSRVGAAAYLFSGLRNLAGPQFKVRVKFDDEIEFSRRTRTVVIGNCGRMLGGLVLMPQARLDDGLLDAVLLSPRGVVGWTAVAGWVISRRHTGHGMVDRHTGREIRVHADRPEEIQIDGDPMGAARAVTARVDPLALVVRVGPAS